MYNRREQSIRYPPRRRETSTRLCLILPHISARSQLCTLFRTAARMPIYEYYCPDCRRRVSLFFRTIRAAQEAAASVCPNCQETRLQRVQSRVAVLRTEDQRMDALANPAMLEGLQEDNPQAMAAMMRQMSESMGEPMAPELNEVVDRLAAGESPEAIDAAMPSLGETSED